MISGTSQRYYRGRLNQAARPPSFRRQTSGTFTLQIANKCIFSLQNCRHYYYYLPLFFHYFPAIASAAAVLHLEYAI